MNARRSLVLHTQAFDAITRCQGHSANEAARRAKISSTTLVYLRSHHRGASESTVEALATALDVDPAALFPQLAGWTPPESAA